jgi:beta-phosphoglucomutase-like phosphatase (HAD superfamily)
MTDYVLSKTTLDRFFEVRVSAEDVQKPKPAPDGYRLALERLGVRATGAVGLEDSEAGVEAAVRAGIAVLGVRHAWNPDHDFTRAAGEFSSLQSTALIIATIESILVPAHV